MESGASSRTPAAASCDRELLRPTGGGWDGRCPTPSSDDSPPYFIPVRNGVESRHPLNAYATCASIKPDGAIPTIRPLLPVPTASCRPHPLRNGVGRMSYGLRRPVGLFRNPSTSPSPDHDHRLQRRGCSSGWEVTAPDSISVTGNRNGVGRTNRPTGKIQDNFPKKYA